MPDMEIQETEPLHITAVELDDNGWYTAQTDGEPKKLSTNREAQGREMGRFRTEGALVKINFVHRQKPNPQGGFFNNYYYYGGSPVAATNGSDEAGITRVKSTSPEKTPQEAWRIALAVGSERAIQLAPHLPEGQANFPFIWALAYEFAARIFLTPLPDASALEALPVGIGGVSGQNDPDDIPF